MEKPKPDFNQGFIKVTYPYTWQMWLIWGLIFIVMLIGLFKAPLGLILSLAMLPFLAIFSPTGLEQQLHKMRKEAPQPDDLEAQALTSGYSLTDWFYGHTEYVPTADASDWVLPAPGPKSWFMQRPYHPDPSNELIPEHPRKIGTPKPANLSSYGLFMIAFLLGMSVFAVIGITEAKASASIEDDTMLLLPYITMGVGAVWLIGGYFKQRQQTVMIDTSTETVRAASAGPTELVGQVRPTFSGGMDIKVDGHPHRLVPGCVSYEWVYEALVRETHTVIRNGKPRRRSKDVWRRVRSRKGDVPFLLHDGTGAIYVRPSTFERKEWGQYAKRWETSDRDTRRDPYWRFFYQEKLFNKGRVLRHRWTIHALRIGNPVYVLGVLNQRPLEELNWPGVSDVSECESPLCSPTNQSSIWENKEDKHVDYKEPVPNARLDCRGRDTPGMPAMMKRGTELTNIARLRSRSEILFLPFLTALAGVFMLLLL